MHLITSRVGRGARDERGAVAIIVAVSMVMLLVVTAMVLDFGMVRFDRQRAKSAADSAVMAGLRAADGDTRTSTRSEASAAHSTSSAATTTDSAASRTESAAAPDPAAVCDPANPGPDAADAVYVNSVTSGGITSEVTIKSPYSVSDGGFVEEGLRSLSADTSLVNGCDQIGVIIRQSRKPGLGSLATSSDLMLRVRSVGRVLNQPGDLAPALLLLERTRCQVLTNGNKSDANPSKIWVYGSGTDPALDPFRLGASDSACDSGANRKQLLVGNKDDGIVAFGVTSGRTRRDQQLRHTHGKA